MFDYDGTIHNTMLIYEKAFRKCFSWLVEQKFVQGKEISSKEISCWLGMNSKDMWNLFQPDLADDIKSVASNKIGEEMLRGISDKTAQWYLGGEEILTRLLKEGYEMIILSNCKTSYKEMNWNYFQMHRWFKEFYDCESFGFAPKEKIIKEIVKKYSGDFIVIGDRRSDFEAAKSIRAKFVGCTYGYGSGEELQGADALAGSICELPEKIDFLTDD